MTREEWSGHIEAQAKSGKTMVAYCREHGLSVSALQYHRQNQKGKFVQVSGTDILELVLAEDIVLKFPSSQLPAVFRALNETGQ